MTLVETLLAFSRKEVPPGQVMRALCEYDGWFAPTEVAAAAFKVKKVWELIAIWGAQSTVAPGKLYLFTDQAQGELALRDEQLGSYVSPVSGATLFSLLPAGFKELHVNPAGPKEQGWFMADEQLELGALWGQAVAFEQVLAGKSDTDNPFDALLDFPNYTVFAFPNGGIADVRSLKGFEKPSMVFTAPDCAARAMERLGPQAASLKPVTLSGEQLFGLWPKLQADGLALNLFGPGPVKVFNAEMCQLIYQWSATRAELKRREAKTKRSPRTHSLTAS